MEHPLLAAYPIAPPESSPFEQQRALLTVVRQVLATLQTENEMRHTEGVSMYDILNESYGLTGQAWQRFEYHVKPTTKEIYQRLHLSRSTYYHRRNHALEVFARAWMRYFENDTKTRK